MALAFEDLEQSIAAVHQAGDTWLLELIAHRQLDTIYHEHFSYLSLTAMERIFTANDRSVFDVGRLAAFVAPTLMRGDAVKR